MEQHLYHTHRVSGEEESAKTQQTEIKRFNLSINPEARLWCREDYSAAAIARLSLAGSLVVDCRCLECEKDGPSTERTPFLASGINQVMRQTCNPRASIYAKQRCKTYTTSIQSNVELASTSYDHTCNMITHGPDHVCS